MTPEQVKLVQDSFQKVAPISDAAATLFYDKLFELDPSVRPLFPDDMAEQGQKLMKMIGTAVNNLHQVETIIPAVQDLGKNHVGYGVKDEHYDTVGAALLWALEAGLKDDFTPEVKAGWAEAYGTLAGVMKEAAATVAEAPATAAEATPPPAAPAPAASQNNATSFFGRLFGRRKKTDTAQA